MRSLPLVILNTLTFGAVLTANYIFGRGVGDHPSVGEISGIYPTLITPSGYAFAIWGLIYLFLTSFVVYQWVSIRNHDTSDLVKPVGIWFSLSNIFNVAWIFLWVNQHLGWSVAAIMGLLISLTFAVIQLECYTATTGWKKTFFMHLPFGIYLGWIILATPLNISVWLEAGGSLVNSPAILWAGLVLAFAVAVYLFLLFQHNRIEPPLVGVWGFVAIAVNQWDNSYPISWIALAGAAFMLVLTLKRTVEIRRQPTA